MTDLRLIPLEGGKYVLHMDSDGIVRVDRYTDIGWRKLSIGVGDKMISALFNRLYDLEQAVAASRAAWVKAETDGLRQQSSMSGGTIFDHHILDKLLEELKTALTGEDGELL